MRDPGWLKELVRIVEETTGFQTYERYGNWRVQPLVEAAKEGNTSRVFFELGRLEGLILRLEAQVKKLEGTPADHKT